MSLRIGSFSSPPGSFHSEVPTLLPPSPPEESPAAAASYSVIEVVNTRTPSPATAPVSQAGTQPYDAESASPVSSLELWEEEDEEYKIPAQRIPPLGNHDTFQSSASGELVPCVGIALFGSDTEVIRAYPMKFISVGEIEAAQQIVAITRAGRHVVFQQASSSCFPTAVTMLALDLGKTPLFGEIRDYVTRSEIREERYLKAAGFTAVKHSLSGSSLDKAGHLAVLLQAKGAGLLNVVHPQVGSHMVVLDAISFRHQTATFRDPYHGRMVVVHLNAFYNWIGDRFLELSS